MSREIKFRCWNAFSQCMHDWSEMVEKNKIHLLTNKNKSYVCEQYTGLKDKNGVEIYEGDILECGSGYLWVVKWNEVHCGFLAEGEDVSELNFNAEVIGNIHQNPELLK